MSREAAMAIANGTAPVVTDVQKEESAAQVPGTDTSSVSTPKDELVSSRIAQIARKEAKYREEQEAFKREMEEFKQSKSKFDPFFEKYKQFEEMRAKDPVAAIKLLGFSDTDYINFVAANEDKSTPEERAAKIAEDKIAQFRKEQETKEQEAEAKRNDESIGQFKKNIGITIKADPDRFEMCNFYGEEAQALILEKVKDHYQKALETDPNAEPLSAEAAADMVEKDFEEALEQLRGLKKFNKQKEPETPTEEVPVAKKEEPLKAQVVTPPKPLPPPAVSRTLTNRAAPTVAATASAAKKLESREEKRERLMKALAEGRAP